MKKWIMGVVMAGMVSASAWGYDTDVFSECSVAVKPNVLFLIDTSLSMREKDVITDTVAPYDPGFVYKKASADSEDQVEKKIASYKGQMNKKSDKRYYTYPGSDGWIIQAPTLCEKAMTAVETKGFWVGKFKIISGTCDSGLKKIVASGNYINYMKYAEGESEKIPWASASTSYDSSIQYRDYWNDGSEDGYGDYETDKIYVKMGGVREFNSLNNSIDGIDDNEGIYVDNRHNANYGVIECESARTALRTKGWTKSKVWEIFGSSCGGAIKYTLMTGNFLNYLEKERSRRYVGIDALWSVIQDNVLEVRFGVMQFDLNYYWSGLNVAHWKSNGGDISIPCDDNSAIDLRHALYGRYPWEDQASTAVSQYGRPLYFGYEYYGMKDVSKETPLAESLVEAGLYFSGQDSWFNDYDDANPYTSPIQCPDQKNYIVLLTDGAPKDDFSWLDSNGKLITFDSDDFTYRWIYDASKKTFRYYNKKGEEVTDETIGNADNDFEDVICWNSIFDNDDDDDTNDSEDDTPDDSCNASNLKMKWLDDVAYFLKHKDLSAKDDEQHITTHVIGLNLSVNADDLDEDLLADTGENGGGGYILATNKGQIIDALNAVLHTVEASFSFSRAATPINQADMIYSSDDIFVATFTLNSIGRGMGNIQKFKRAGEVVVGQGDTPLFETNGSVDTAVKDYWAVSNGTTTKKDSTDTSIPDQGVASRLYRKINNGLILPDSPSPTDIFNAVKQRRRIYVAYKGGSIWRQGILGDLATDGLGEGAPSLAIKKDDTNNYEGERLAHFLATEVYGYGYEWPLGDIIHSNIVVAQYPKDEIRDYERQSYIFAGANDGLLHCFDSNGEEVWAFVFPDFVDRLRYLSGTSEVSGRWFADGFMTLYYSLVKYDDSGTMVDNDKDSYSYVVRKPEYLVIGERRAGSFYHIIDVSNVNDGVSNVPVYKARVGGTTGWGLSWSKPQLCQVATSGGVEKGFLVAGGYDENQDKLRPGVDKKGRFVALFDFEGDLIKRFPDTGFGSDACIISARIIDHDHERNVNDKRIFSRIYAGDLNGNVYHMSDDLTADFQDKVPNGGWNVGHKLFSAQTFNVVVTENGANHQVDYHQKIFHAPVAGYACDTKMVFFGTGDREHPLYADPGFVDSVYAVPERWSGEALACRDLSQVMVTMKPNPAIVGSGVVLESYSISKNPPKRTTACKEYCSEGAVACSENCLDAYDPERCETECSENCLGADDPATCETACFETCLDAVDPEPCETECSSAYHDCLTRCDEGEVKGWFFNFPCKRYKGNVLVDTPGEKMISEPLVVGNNMIFGTYTPPVVVPADPLDICNPAAECEPGAGRIYVVNTCHNAFSVKSYLIKNNPMPQPALVFDKNTGKVLISTGEGKIIDPEIPVVVPDYWKHSGADL
ncbi:PilC/PilY family type IV pilus protein [Desulfoluna butyratoxydans]|uniref:Pilc beta-propeller domain n=1 Tax=Desulfoluna butyratoxydans TaxID=231438 RepID=A0A4V6IKV0_9BACT|nr:PilC/PilY family type IV pilus protein [Desulfoluna butyratoxydans]VFQ42648.1 pilc beta-propeller domain [Desulfoluna butyratoxydans]